MDMDNPPAEEEQAEKMEMDEKEELSWKEQEAMDYTSQLRDPFEIEIWEFIDKKLNHLNNV